MTTENQAPRGHMRHLGHSRCQRCDLHHVYWEQSPQCVIAEDAEHQAISEAEPMQPPATRETRGTAPDEPENQPKCAKCGKPYFFPCCTDTTMFPPSAERVSQPVAPPPLNEELLNCVKMLLPIAHLTCTDEENRGPTVENCDDAACAYATDLLKRVAGTHPPQEGWISVKDKLPDGTKCVLVYAPTADSDLDSPIQVAWYAKEARKWEGEIFSLTENVTHWQSLPEPPIPHGDD